MDKQKIRLALDQVFGDMAGAMTSGMVYLGVRTGLFRAMDGQGPLTAAELVERTGLQERYVQEWLKGMVCAGYLSYESEQETFELTPEFGFLLASDGTDHFAGGLFMMTPPLLSVAPKVAAAFRDGGGVDFGEYGDDGILALDMVNRGNYEHKLVSYWLPSMPEVVSRLEAGAKVLDLGCGSGHALMAMAEAYPRSSFTGVDIDEESIESARRAAAEKGLASSIVFEAVGVETLEPAAQYDLITAFDCVHDFANPLATLEEVKKRLKPEGTFFVVEPKAADELEQNRHAVGTMFYGFSLFHCMTQSLAQGGPGLGTCMGPRKTGELMQQAGFTQCRQLEIKSQVNLFYAVTQ